IDFLENFATEPIIIHLLMKSQYLIKTHPKIITVPMLIFWIF
ncbi:hypothetical protein HMPREF1352_01838, partial [Enterococcus faecium 511]